MLKSTVCLAIFAEFLKVTMAGPKYIHRLARKRWQILGVYDINVELVERWFRGAWVTSNHNRYRKTKTPPFESTTVTCDGEIEVLNVYDNLSDAGKVISRSNMTNYTCKQWCATEGIKTNKSITVSWKIHFQQCFLANGPGKKGKSGMWKGHYPTLISEPSPGIKTINQHEFYESWRHVYSSYIHW